MKERKFHRSRDGQIRPCSASENECPLGEHFSSPEAAARAAIADAGVPVFFNTDMASEVDFEATRTADGQVLITAIDLEDGGEVTYGPLRELSDAEARAFSREEWGSDAVEFQEGEVFETVDGDGRLVILAKFRDRFHLGAATEA